MKKTKSKVKSVRFKTIIIIAITNIGISIKFKIYSKIKRILHKILVFHKINLEKNVLKLNYLKISMVMKKIYRIQI
jgi:hypothetical protein